ncbi:hypothetical protein P7K49_009248 [Saguinus oedipus]|uniref:Uncharacterized protein n=1 Tax=Saguinus oedipus TaxID=9490 RepID=A0ABQ9VJH4_SAGOE|nr:hypothetical protein P7K49_009248 [Saguinus oedipus]
METARPGAWTSRLWSVPKHYGNRGGDGRRYARGGGARRGQIHSHLPGGRAPPPSDSRLSPGFRAAAAASRPPHPAPTRAALPLLCSCLLGSARPGAQRRSVARGSGASWRRQRATHTRFSGQWRGVGRTRDPRAGQGCGPAFPHLLGWRR